MLKFTVLPAHAVSKTEIGQVVSDGLGLCGVQIVHQCAFHKIDDSLDAKVSHVCMVKPGWWEVSALGVAVVL